jgi:hypothetical protein
VVEALHAFRDVPLNFIAYCIGNGLFSFTRGPSLPGSMLPNCVKGLLKTISYFGRLVAEGLA